jgi:YidC/Oxa1 family membrane protein insertase
MDSIGNLLSPLSDFFFRILEFIHGWGISWSWSIVVLTIIVRIILIPLTWRQIKSMRAMQALAPEIKALQEKYKDNKQLLNQKTMEFYQENKVSPFGSCLPLLLQMPVFFGLYYMLREQGQPGGAFAFPNPTVSWLWIQDITKFDIILMFLYIGSQFVASWQTARKGAGQQKMIAYMMPIMVGIFMFIGKWPAGLFIYWFTSNVWTIAQQYVAERMMPMPVPVVASSAKDKSPARTPAKPGAKTGNAPTKPKAPSTQPAKKSGGKTSGQKTAAKGQATGSKSQRPDGGTGGSKSSG